METVVECKKAKDWTNPKNGQTVPIYQIGLSDGMGGQSFGKEIPLGTPVGDLLITDKGQFGLDFKLKNATGNQFQGGKNNFSNASVALSYSKDLVVGGKIDIKQILPIADKLYAWLEGKKAQAPVQSAASLPETKGQPVKENHDATNDLPF